MRRVLEKHTGYKAFVDEFYQGQNALPSALLKLVEKEALIDAHADLREKFDSNLEAERYFNGPHLIPADKAVAPVLTFKDSQNPNDVGRSLISYGEHVAHEAARKQFPNAILRANREIQDLIEQGIPKEQAESQVIQLYERVVNRTTMRAKEQGIISPDQGRSLEEFIELRVRPSRSTEKKGHDSPGESRRSDPEPADSNMQAALEQYQQNESGGTSVPNRGKKRGSATVNV